MHIIDPQQMCWCYKHIYSLLICSVEQELMLVKHICISPASLMFGSRSRKTHLQQHGFVLLILWVEDFLSQLFYRYIQAAVSRYLQQTDVQASLEPRNRHKDLKKNDFNND